MPTKLTIINGKLRIDSGGTKKLVAKPNTGDACCCSCKQVYKMSCTRSTPATYPLCEDHRYFKTTITLPVSITLPVDISIVGRTDDALLVNDSLFMGPDFPDPAGANICTGVWVVENANKTFTQTDRELTLEIIDTVGIETTGNLTITVNPSGTTECAPQICLKPDSANCTCACVPHEETCDGPPTSITFEYSGVNVTPSSDRSQAICDIANIACAIPITVSAPTWTDINQQLPGTYTLSFTDSRQVLGGAVSMLPAQWYNPNTHSFVPMTMQIAHDDGFYGLDNGYWQITGEDIVYLVTDNGNAWEAVDVTQWVVCVGGVLGVQGGGNCGITLVGPPSDYLAWYLSPAATGCDASFYSLWDFNPAQTSFSDPYDPNYDTACHFTAGTAITVTNSNDNTTATITSNGGNGSMPFTARPDAPPVLASTAPPAGPGTELKKLLKKIGIEATPDCPCNARAKVMDKWGPDTCTERLDEIVGWLREEAEKRSLPFVDIAARLVVKRAIANARKHALKPI